MKNDTFLTRVPNPDDASPEARAYRMVMALDPKTQGVGQYGPVGPIETMYGAEITTQVITSSGYLARHLEIPRCQAMFHALLHFAPQTSAEEVIEIIRKMGVPT